MKITRVKAKNTTNPNILQLKAIAKIVEWEELIEYLEDDEEGDEVVAGFAEMFRKVVIDGEEEASVFTP